MRCLVMLGFVLVGCYGPDDFEGASNTPDYAVPGACDTLRSCCEAASTDTQTACLAASGNELECTQTLRSMRAGGSCP